MLRRWFYEEPLGVAIAEIRDFLQLQLQDVPFSVRL